MASRQTCAQPYPPRLQPNAPRLQPYAPRLQPYASRLQPYPMPHRRRAVLAVARLCLLWLYLLWLYFLWRTVLAVTGLPRVAVRQPPPRLERDHLGEVDQAHHRLARRRQQPVGGRNGGGRTGGGRRGRGLRLPPVSVVHEEQRDTNELMLEEPG